jgi:peptidoglycan/LPS O-acetylase OafA/YrhL
MADPADAVPAQTTQAGPKFHYEPGLEGLRGVAAALVLLYHLGPFIVPGEAEWLLRGGFLGVDIFFVLSGFLITSLLLRELDRHRRINKRRFYARRAVRLLPALALVLVAHLLYTAVIGDSIRTELRIDVLAVPSLFNYYHVIWSVFPPLSMSHLWTLSVEAQFYAVWPLLLPLLWRRVRRVGPAVGVLLASAAVIALVRYLEYRSSHSWSLVYTRTEARADTLLIGAALAVLCSRRSLPRHVVSIVTLVGAGALATFVVLAQASSPMLFEGGFTLVALATAAVVAGALQPGSVTRRVLSWSPLRLVGRISYSLYLWHLPVYVWVHTEEGSLPTLARVVLALTVTIALSTASYLLVERPLLHMPRLRAV